MDDATFFAAIAALPGAEAGPISVTWEADGMVFRDANGATITDPGEVAMRGVEERAAASIGALAEEIAMWKAAHPEYDEGGDDG